MKQSSLQIIKDEHAALRAMLQSLTMMLDRGPGDEPENFFDVVRAMLFYIDEFPEKLHHPKESNLLFPRVARLAPEALVVVQLLQRVALEAVGDARAAPRGPRDRLVDLARFVHAGLRQTKQAGCKRFQLVHRPTPCKPRSVRCHSQSAQRHRRIANAAHAAKTRSVLR